MVLLEQMAQLCAASAPARPPRGKSKCHSCAKSSVVSQWTEWMDGCIQLPHPCLTARMAKVFKNRLLKENSGSCDPLFPTRSVRWGGEEGSSAPSTEYELVVLLCDLIAGIMWYHYFNCNCLR